MSENATVRAAYLGEHRTELDAQSVRTAEA
jgi:hypothetical protein